ncbi:MAG: sensor histidine kinase [Oscillospiraceae bacterium]|nr:sensor histidine kinase [Oscillospiraceae bacterium]
MRKSVRFKIILYTLLCLAAVGLFSNLYLYSYINNIVETKADAIDHMYLETIRMQLDTQFSEISDLAILCTSSTDVSRLMRNTELTSLTQKREALRVQSQLNDYLFSFSQGKYINKLIIFNEHHVSVQASAKNSGTVYDLSILLDSDFYKQRSLASAPFSTLVPSITPYKEDCLAGLFPIVSNINNQIESYLYIELSPDIITDILNPYSTLNPIFVATQNQKKILKPYWSSAALQNVDMNRIQEHSTFSDGGIHRKVMTEPLTTTGLTIYSCPDVTTMSVDNKNMVYTLVVVSVSMLLVSICILTILSNYITRPIRKLIERIERISGNDFSFDPEIEKSEDEIGAIGKVINEMTLSIKSLLEENQERNEQQKNIEIALLQSQVNPHFLYNTLDSIHWMAVIQKSPGISQITQSLSNLLKNLAKGTQDHITLGEELSLLHDYTAIQEIRYMEMFEVINHIDEKLLSYKIIKFTLQPLIENAIFHGIEPTGNCGTITLNGYTDENFLYISIEDNGVGMDEATLQELLSNTKKAKNRGSLNGIGVRNVDQRLKLTYGAQCGLTFKSIQGEGTTVTVKIPKEKDTDV